MFATVKQLLTLSDSQQDDNTCVDDVTKKSADAWEELFIDAYNSTERGTRMYGVETFKTLPIVSANWSVGAERPRGHTRSIHIAFQ